LQNESIKPEQVAVSIDYASAGFDYVDITLGHSSIDALTRHAVAETMMSKSDCRTCHHVSKDGIGPSFTDISEKYKSQPKADTYLANKITNGSANVWHKETAMPAHPSITQADAQTIARYILNITNKKTLPVSGNYKTITPANDNGRGTYIFRAAYTDRTVNKLPSLSSENVLILKSPVILSIDADSVNGMIRDHLDEYTFMTARPDSYLMLKDIDLTDIKSIQLIPNWHLYDIYKGGAIEVRLDRLDGETVCKTEMLPQQFNMRYRGAFGGLDDAKKKEAVAKLNLPSLDERAFFAPGVDKNNFTLPSTAPLKSTSGKHDIYFVFKNEEVAKTEALFPLARIVFDN
jgi:cytochrome c